MGFLQISAFKLDFHEQMIKDIKMSLERINCTFKEKNFRDLQKIS